ncbi:hypothetical protein Tco_0246279 [Tanacetum coccineum]
MKISIADQISLDDALVAPADRLKIGKCNLRLSSDVTSKEATLQVVYDVLKLTPFYKAFQVTADAPEIYMQELWVSAYVHNRSVRFKMNNKKHILDLDQFRDILQICPKVGNKKFVEPPLENEILTFLASLGHSGEIRKITDVNVNKLHQPWRSFAAIINKCLSGKPSYDSLRLSQAQILWGMYNKKKVDYAYLLWEDFIYQIENKNTKKGNAMYYPRFTKLVVNFVMNKDPSIPRRNKVNWHYARDDPMFTTINVISRNEDTQLYGSILPVALTNEDIRNSESYKEYYAIASGKIPPKTKGSKKKADTDAITKQKPPTVPKEKKEKKSGKGKQKAKELETISEANLTEAEQLKILTKRSRKETHISQASGSGADEGTGITPGVPDALDYALDVILLEITWLMIKMIRKLKMMKELKALEDNLSEFKQTNQYAEALSANPDPKTSHAVAANLSELELKKILIDKMEAKNSINRLKDGSTDDDQEPSAGTGRRSKRRRSRKDLNLPVLQEKRQHEVGKTTKVLRLISNLRGSNLLRESAHDVYSKRRIIAVTKVEIVKWQNYKHLDWITGKVTNLNVEERIAFNVSLRMFTRSVVIQRRVEDLQLGVESYQKKLNLSKPDTYRSNLRRRDAYTPYSDPRGFIYENKDKKNRLMRIDELHKFSDGTLDDVRSTLNDRLKGIRMDYLPQTFWSQCDKANERAMIQAIDKRLKTRRIMRSLERFVGGRPYGDDLRLLQRTILFIICCSHLKKGQSSKDRDEIPQKGSDHDEKVRIGIMPTEMELTLMKPKHGVSSEVSVDPHGFEEGGEDFRYSDTERLSRNDKVLKSKNFKKDATLKLSKSSNQE